MGVVGAGGIAAPHVEAWRALGAQVVVQSRRPPADFAAQHGAAVAGTLDELLARCEVVDVCSPTPTHESVVLAALAAGRPVVCEKPLARTAGAAQRLVDAAASAGLMLFPAHVVRYFPEYVELRRRVADGAVGEVRSLRLTRRVESPPAGSWFHDSEQSGGVVLDLMLHDLDQALWLLGPVRSLSAERLDPAGDSVRAVLEHVDGGRSTVEARWGQAGTPFATSAEVEGNRGSLNLTDCLPAERAEDPYLAQLRDAVEHLRSGRPTRVTPADGVAAVELAERVIAALPVQP